MHGTKKSVLQLNLINSDMTNPQIKILRVDMLLVTREEGSPQKRKKEKEKESPQVSVHTYLCIEHSLAGNSNVAEAIMTRGHPK